MAAQSRSRASSPGHGLNEDDLIYVYEALRPVRKNYTFLGLLIGVKKAEIDTIATAEQADPSKCLLEILSLRLKNKTPALTWNDIDKALRSESIGEHRLANKLQRTHYGKKPDPSLAHPSLAHPSFAHPSFESTSEQQHRQKGDKRSRHKQKFKKHAFAQQHSKTSEEDSDNEVDRATMGLKKAKGEYESFSTSSKGKGVSQKSKTKIEKSEIQTGERVLRKGKKRKNIEVGGYIKHTSSKEKSTKERKRESKMLPEKKQRNVKVLTTEELSSDISQSDSDDGQLSSSNEEMVSNEEEDVSEPDDNTSPSSEESFTSFREVKKMTKTCTKRKIYAKTNVEIASSEQEFSGEEQLQPRGSRWDQQSNKSRKRHRESSTSPIATGSFFPSASEEEHSSKGRGMNRSDSSPTIRRREMARGSLKLTISGNKPSPERKGVSWKERQVIDSSQTKQAEMRKEKKRIRSTKVAENRESPLGIYSSKSVKGKTKRIERRAEKETLDISHSESEEESSSYWSTNPEDQETEQMLSNEEEEAPEPAEDTSGESSTSHRVETKEIHQESPTSYKKSEKRRKAMIASSHDVSEDEQLRPSSSSSSRDRKRKRRRKKHRKSSVSPRATKSSFASASPEEHRSKVKGKRGDCRRNKDRHGEEMERESLSSSTEMDDSSPECDMLKNISESETQKLRKIFKCAFGKLCCTITEPVKTAAELQGKRLVSLSTMKDMVASPESQQVKTIALIHALYRKIKSRSDRIFTVIDIFLKSEVMHEVGRELWFKTGKVCPERTAFVFGSELPPPVPGGQQTVKPSSTAGVMVPVSASTATKDVTGEYISPPEAVRVSVSQPVLTQYEKYLRSCYKARPLAAADKYLPTLNAPYINLAMVSREHYGPEQRDEFTRQTLHGGVDQILRSKKPLKIEDLLTPEDSGRPVRFILVEVTYTNPLTSEETAGSSI